MKNRVLNARGTVDTILKKRRDLIPNLIKVVEKIINFIEPAVIYKPEKFISKQDFISSLIFANNIDEYKGDDLVYGKIGKTNFGFSELIMRNKYIKKRKKPDFKGLFFVADFNKIVKYRLLITNGKVENKFIFRKERLVENFENPEFEKLLSVYCYDQLTARYVITPEFMDKILKFRALARENISISIVDLFIYIAIPVKQNLFEPPLVKPRGGYFLIAREILIYMILCLNIVNLLR